MAAAHADVPNLAALDDIMQCLHRFLNRCIIVKAMALQEIDVVELETPERVLYAFEDVLA